MLPRILFDPSDHFGFGDGIGFHLRHTLAAGLVNTDELLTLLQFDLFGWPPLFALGLLGVPFLLGRARRAGTGWRGSASSRSWSRTSATSITALRLGRATTSRRCRGCYCWRARGVQVLAELAGSWAIAVVLVGV